MTMATRSRSHGWHLPVRVGTLNPVRSVARGKRQLRRDFAVIEISDGQASILIGPSRFRDQVKL